MRQVVLKPRHIILYPISDENNKKTDEHNDVEMMLASGRKDILALARRWADRGQRWPGVKPTLPRRPGIRVLNSVRLVVDSL